MDGILKTTEKKEIEEEFSFKKLFVPLTTLKAIHWIILIGIIVYFNVLFNGFVADDIPFIVSDPSIHTFNILSLFGNNTFNSDGYYRPIPAIYFSLLWNLFGNTAIFYHFFQILLHLFTSCLLFFVLKRFFKISIAFFLVLIFLIHPIQTESVAVIGATQSELFSLFGLSALLISIKDKLNQKSLLIISLLLLFSLLTKETGFLFLLLVLLYQLLFKRQRFFSFISYTLITIFLYSFIRFMLAKVYLMKITTTPLGILPLSERLINIPAIVFYYIKTFFYPAQLSIDQQWSVTTINFQQFYFPLLVDLLFFVALVIGGVLIYLRKKNNIKLYLFFFVWIIMGLGLLLQIFPLDFTISDRWFYFPIIGFLGLFGIIIQNIRIKTNYKSIVISFAVLCIVALSIRSIVRNANYIDAKTLYLHDAKNSYQLENLLGNMYFQENNLKEAKIHYLNSIAVWPCSDAHNNLGYLYQTTGSVEAAKQEYIKAVNCEYSEKAYGNLIVLLYKMNNLNLAEQYSKEAIHKYPQEGGLYYILGIIEYKKGDKSDALQSLKTAYTYNQDPLIIKIYKEIENNEQVQLPL